MKHVTKAQLFVLSHLRIATFLKRQVVGFPTLLLVSRQVSFMNESILKDRAKLVSQGNNSARTRSKTDLNQNLQVAKRVKTCSLC